MKNLLFLFFLLPSFLFAQGYAEQEMSMSKGVKNGYSITFEGLDEKDVVKIWEQYAKSDLDAKAKRDRKSDEYFSDDAKIPDLSANTVDVYASVNKQSDGTHLNVWFDLGGAYLNKIAHSDRMFFVEKMANNLTLQGEAVKTERILEEEEKVLKNMNKDLDGLAKEKSRFETDIEKAKAKIQEAEAGIEANVKAQAIKEDEIKEQAGRIQEVKNELSNLTGKKVK